MNTKLKMAIVGAGVWGENHAKIYQAHPFCETTAVCGRNAGKAKALADKIGVERYVDYPRGFAFESIRSFADCILSGDEFKVTLEDAANTSLAVMESAKKRMPVEVEYRL
ncbi:MAG: Gfo/Idh/MocA family oxidoreductase [Treponema sp.]|jgi:predicted dehydrogenase|nr:Gfo/Idh/MocA family oxidoreductase [Treponema sp.]